MKYTGYKDLDSALKNLQTQMNRICDSALAQLRQELNAKLPQIMKNISAEILSAYKMIVYQEF
jgi:phosphoenolpyruvate carboxylase